MQLVPVLTDPNSGIESRAALLKQNILKQLDKLKVDKAHIVSHSLSGLDMRYAISSLGLSNRIHSLTTIATPHKYNNIYDLEDLSLQISSIRNIMMIRFQLLLSEHWEFMMIHLFKQ